MTGEVDSCRSKFIKPLICDEHLTEHIIFARAPPRTFNSLDVFAFCNRRAESIWSAKESDELQVMRDRVLPWERERGYSITIQENLAIMMETGNGVLQLLQCALGYGTLSYNVTKFEKRMECAYDFHWDMSLDGCYINLVGFCFIK
jgi:hypothetical protein